MQFFKCVLEMQLGRRAFCFARVGGPLFCPGSVGDKMIRFWSFNTRKFYACAVETERQKETERQRRRQEETQRLRRRQRATKQKAGGLGERPMGYVF